MNAKMLCASAVLGLAALVLMAAQPAHALCTYVAVTADEISKGGAVARSQSGLKEAIDKWARGKGIKTVRITPSKSKPQPYWREAISADLYLKPDVRTSNFYTVCWRGVISPVVCTSGARACG